MRSIINKSIALPIVLIFASCLALVIIIGCDSQSAGSQNAGSGGASSEAPTSITVGTLATEDILPLWVAKDEGWTAEFNVDVEVVEFQSATELIAGVVSGNVDAAMTDIMVAASLFASGTDVQMEWVTLGADPSQGRFGIMVGPDSDVQSAAQLASVPIAVGSNTILEYVVDGLMEEAGVPADQVVIEEIQKLPVRYQAMLSGEVAAAGLPASLLALGEANGCRTIAEDTQGRNLSTSVMICRTSALENAATADALADLRKAWDEAVTAINETPEAFQELLVSHANLSEVIAETYPVPNYPLCALPTSEMVDPVLAWMEQKGYLTQPLTYDQATGTFSFV